MPNSETGTSTDYLNSVPAGFPIIQHASEVVPDPRAARMLAQSDDTILAVGLAGNVLEVLIAQAPTPALLRRLADESGMLVTVKVTSRTVIDEVRAVLQPAGSAPLVIGPAMEEAVKLGASDLHLAVGTPPIVRVAGALIPLEHWSILSVADLEAAATWVTGDLANFTGDLDCSVSFLDRRWRVSLYKQRNQLAMALRLIPATPPQADELGLPASVLRLASLTSGLVLFCGPTGSGKTTSMAALIDRINRSRSCHILTIEDPIEYLHVNRRAIVHQREVGSDTAGFALGLRSALRQDPDVLLVGELRDLETMSTALAAAETGHLVLATVHSSSVASAVTRLVSSFPAGEQDRVRQQLANSLQAVVFQVLLPAVRGGRVLATEVLITNTAIRTVIRTNKLEQLTSMLDSSGSETGMMSIDRALAQLVAAGIVIPEVAIPYVTDIKNYTSFLGSVPQLPITSIDPLTDLPSFKSEQ